MPLSHDSHPYSRRKLLQVAGLAAGSTALSIACGRPNGSTQPSPESAVGAPPASPSGVSRVVLVRSEDRVAGTHRALDLLQPDGFKGQTVFLKPNYNTGDPAPAATDTPLLEALVQDLQTAGAGPITVGDRSGMADTRSAMQRKGVFDLAERYGLNSLVFDELERDGWQYVAADGTHWPQGFAVARPVLESGAVVNTCCLKTHRFGGHFTLSLKNTIGLVAKYVPGDSHNYMQDLHGSPHQRRMIAEANVTYDPALVLLDGVEAFVNGGPDRGETVKPGVILAGTDRVAVDAIAIALLRWLGTTDTVSQGAIWELDQIQRAVELGLGAASPDQVEFVTADAPSQTLADQLRPLLQA